jgi:2-dehydropantoate 2-reductase
MIRRGRIDVRVGQSEKRVLWHKLARIAPLAAVTSVSGRTVGELRTDPEWRQKLDAALVESCAVAEADGVSLRPAAQWAIIEEMADETTTSAARDVVAGRRSELDAILGGVLRTAERLDVPCPRLTELAVAAGLR